MSVSAAETAALPRASFQDATGHLLRELARLDQIIARRIHLFRCESAATEIAVRAAPTYVSDQEADALLRRELSRTVTDETCLQIQQRIAGHERAIEQSLAACERDGLLLPLPRLARLFELSWLDVQTLLVCLAPELRRKYDRLYAYLQDDITRRRPSLDLVLDLFIDDEQQRWQARALLENGALFRHQLVRVHEDAQSLSGSSGLARLLEVDARLLQFILGESQPDVRLANVMNVLAPQSPWCADALEPEPILRLIEANLNGATSRHRLLIHLHGPQGVAQRDTALAVCHALDCSLLVVDGAALLTELQQNGGVLRLMGRESLLLQAPLLIENIEDWLNDANAQGLRRLLDSLQEYCWLSFTSSTQTWPAGRLPLEMALLNIELQLPDAEQRERLWRHALAEQQLSLPAEIPRTLATQYRLAAPQIRAAARQLRLRTPDAGATHSADELAWVCRGVSRHGLGELAARVAPRYGWSDLILPDALLTLLQDICHQVHHQRQVFDEWGFAGQLPYGRGLSVLFSGSPGTGKTMAAQVIARELDRSLLAVDLSGVVSKYIGETEKNLSRVFNEAQSSNAILFFDEADALFGKRTEVADAHDRYANIEVSYLLQRMEDYDGIVILATNFRDNMDDAFVRRIRFIIDFPFPDEDSRLRIWRKALPLRTPVAADVDFDWLAGRIRIAGGNIKNVVLNAAFGAAQEGAALGMRHLLHSCKQEFQKIGKLWDDKHLKHSGEH